MEKRGSGGIKANCSTGGILSDDSCINGGISVSGGDWDSRIESSNMQQRADTSERWRKTTAGT
eukprot:CAMPEP_0183360996 /NCGR_PEP_ID=MMETSP0164_2-20130417/56190_1 /TAXON_ID=221442 /ORGANISM="Coccolithus pelagicus ssp braarudi, Strain PLY182g" /LENGTH=62 /DNA_ID=CAMNT_0025535447 /DNA_START=822 /DNA_END=1010 /DNA_ORIENTATION=-